MSQNVTIMTFTQWSRGTDWRLALPHSEDNHALVWITKGQARATLEGVQRGLGIHNVLAIPAGTLFSFEPGPQCFGLVCLVSPSGPVLMPDRAQLMRILEVQPQVELTGFLEGMLRESNQGRAFSDEAMNAYAALITVWLRRAMIDHPAPARRSAAQRLVMAYTALIERDFHTPKVMADYAAELGVTPTHLTRSCKHCAGMTAADLLTRCTLHAARDMLETSQDAIRLIAAQLGFRSAAYFSRFILQHTGHSPSALRKAAHALI